MTNKGEWGSLYNHPKLMCMYYQKDDMNHSRQQRTAELNKAMKAGAKKILSPTSMSSGKYKPVLFNSS
jgi:hypothetical protein